MGLTRRARATTVAATALATLTLACAGADAGNAPAADAFDTVAASETALPTVRAGTLALSRIVAPAPIADAPMALYLEIANLGATADTLVAIESADAHAASLHETAGGAMRALPRLVVPAGDTVALRPGGLHAMLEGTTRALAPGDTLRATLHFARAGDVAIAAPVVAYADLERLLGAAAHAGH